MGNNKRLANILVILICIILIEFIIIICVINQKPEVIIEEKEILVPYQTIIEKEIPVVQKESYIYNITSVEREMLARLVYLEANTESIDCQKAIASVVINRWQNGYWGDTLEDVIYAKGQFTPSKIIPQTTPTENNYEAVDYVIKNGCTIPEYVLYFRANYGFSQTWDGYNEYVQIDHTYFGYLSKDKK